MKTTDFHDDLPKLFVYYNHSESISIWHVIFYMALLKGKRIINETQSSTVE